MRRVIIKAKYEKKESTAAVITRATQPGDAEGTFSISRDL